MSAAPDLTSCPLASRPAPDTTEALLALLGGAPSGAWLDLGCGGGKTAERLRSLGCDALGVDKDPRGTCEGVIKGDMLALPFENAAFDGCIAECSLSVCGDAVKALAEAARVLKTGGALLLSDVYFKNDGAPSLSLGAPATRERWERLIERSGFEIIALADATDAWRGFVARLIWESAETDELFGGADDVKGAGYFLTYAVKGASKGNQES